MEEQASWKGHTFTLFVFTGIVVLCSIFFILGMLVGKAQAQKIASSAAPAETLKAESKPAPPDEKPNFTFYDSVKKEEPAALQPAPAKPDSPPVTERPNGEPAPPPPVTSRLETVINYQIAALRKSADAEKLLAEVKKKGFRAFILAPTADDPNPLFRVQVGPFTDPVEAQDGKKKLESAGYQPIFKK
jgi:cell division septation protein DedD